MQDEFPLNDPVLEALARQLAAAGPTSAAHERDALLYECGFAAGRQSAARSLGRWRALAASLALVAVGLGLLSTGSRYSVPDCRGGRRRQQRLSNSRRRSTHAGPDLGGRAPTRRTAAGSFVGQLVVGANPPSWEAPTKSEVLSTPESPSQQTMLRAGSAWAASATAK